MLKSLETLFKIIIKSLFGSDSSGGVFIWSVFCYSVSVKNTSMIIRKNDSKVFLIIYCINIKTLLILINYQKGHTILIKKNGMINKKTFY